MRVEVIEGFKKGTKIYYCGDGYYYYSNSKKNGKIYLRCSGYFKVRCAGRAVCSEDLTNFKPTKCHTAHRRTKSLPEVRALRRRILDDCATRNPAKFSNIVWKHSVGCSRKVRAQNTAVKLRSSMRRARKSPDIPQGFVSAHEILSANEHVHRTLDGEGSMYAGRCGSSYRRDHCLIFISKTMKEAMARADKIFADGTEDGTPSLPGCKQIYSITTTWDSQIVPLCIALMRRKTERSYFRLLQSLKQLVPKFNPSIIHCDFETAQHNAFKRMFPGAVIEGCLFHYAKDLSEQARRLGLSYLIINDDVAYSIIRSTLAIPMVPKNLLGRAFIQVMKRAMDEELFDELEEFFEYLYNEWVTKRRDVLSVCNSEDRTNNVAESWNAKLQSIQEQVHPNFYQCIDGFIRLEEEACQNIYCMKKGIATGRPRKVSALRNDDAIQKLTRLLLLGHISVSDFLRQASFRILAPFSKVFPRGDESDDSD